MGAGKWKGKGDVEYRCGKWKERGRKKRDYLKHVISVIKHAEKYLLVSFSPMCYLL